MQITIKKRYDTYAAGLEELDREFTEGLSRVTDRNVIVAHEAFGYLCSAYSSMNQIGIEGLTRFGAGSGEDGGDRTVLRRKTTCVRCFLKNW